MADLRALVLVCTLKPSPADSSSHQLGSEVSEALGSFGVTSEVVRVVDHDVKFGVDTDEGNGDGWPSIRAKMLDADILVLSTPIWMGQPASVCKMVLERLDAELSETDDEGRLLTYGKCAAVAVVGNEDGAHHSIAEWPAGAQRRGFLGRRQRLDLLGRRGDAVRRLQRRPPHAGEDREATQSLAANTVHLAQLLQASAYPAG